MDIISRVLSGGSSSRSGKLPAGGKSLIDPTAEGMDVSFVDRRTLIVGRPSDRETDLGDRRINQKLLAKWLEQKFDGRYMLFNLSTKDRSTIDYALFRNQVLDFLPANRSDVSDDTPTLGQIFRVVYALHFWHTWDATTVAVLFCNTGLTRSALFASAYLVYTGVQPSLDTALTAVSLVRTGDASALAGSLWPSWRSLMRGLETALAAPAPCLPRVFSLSCIILRAPELRAYLSGSGWGEEGRLPKLQLFHGPNVVWDSVRDCEAGETVWWEGDNLLAEVTTASSAGRPFLLCGDFQLWVTLPSARMRGTSGSVGGVALVASSASNSAVLKPPLRSGPSVGVSSSDLVGRWIFHTNSLEAGATTLLGPDGDVLKPALSSGFELNLILDAAAPADVARINLDRLLKASFIGLKGMRALQQGARDFSSRHYVFPDPAILQALVKEGIDPLAACCALQRANNALGLAREALDTPALKDIFREAAEMRDFKLIQACLTKEECAAALAARANMAVKQRGLQIGDLDVSSLLSALKLVGDVPGGGAGAGKGPGKGGKGRKKKGKKGKKGEDDSDASSEDASRPCSEEGSSEEEEEEEEVTAEAAAKAAADLAALGVDMSASKLFEGEEGAKDEEEEEVGGEEGEEGEEYAMKDHPIFGAWMRALADGSKSKEALLKELAEGCWNPALLDVAPDALVPDLPALTVPLKEWPLFAQYGKMQKVGLPRPQVENKMQRDSLNPALLDADPASIPSATIISEPRKGKKKAGPTRKRLHWVPIRGKVEGTVWGGPPGDVIAAARLLITDEEEFNRLFIQQPDDGKKKKKAGAVQLVDPKRAMNCGIALAKLKMPAPSVVDCLLRLSCRTSDGKGLLTADELHSLITLTPTEEEVMLVKAYKGDVKKLGAVEHFFLAVGDVPACKARAVALAYQCEFDSATAASTARIVTFSKAVAQVRDAPRLHRLLKCVLVLGNKMNGVSVEARKGTVKAFTLASLSQLYLTKTFSTEKDPSISVLVYLFSLLRKVDPDLLLLANDFPDGLLTEAVRLPLDTLSTDVAELREGLTALEGTVRDAIAAGAGNAGGGGGAEYVEESVAVDRTSSSSEASGAEEDAAGTPSKAKAKAKRRVRKVRRRVEPLTTFAGLAQTALEGVTRGLEGAVNGYRELLKLYKEDPELPADELFTNLKMFTATWETQLKVLVDKKKKEKAARKRARAAARRKVELAEAKRRAEEGSSSSGSDESESGTGESDGGQRLAHTRAALRAPPQRSSSAKHAPSISTGTTSTTGSSDQDVTTGPAPGAWATAAPAAPLAEEEEEEEEKEAPKATAGGGADSGRGGLLAAIAKRGGAPPASSPGASAPASDARGGLLAAIAKRGGATAAPPAASPAGADPRGSLLAAIAKRGGGAATGAPPASSPGGEGGGDPRSGLLAEIAKRRGGGSPS